MRLALRIDDIGASSKRYEIYSKKFRGLGNFLFMKYLPFFNSWGPYRELTSVEWEQIFKILNKYYAKLTVGITAAWVEKDGSLVPFPTKYNQEAAKIKEGLDSGLLEIANHGLTHCVVGKHLPRLFTSNRTFHREFWEWLPDKIHFEHIRRSQEILQDFFQTPVTTFIPPGNVYSGVTIRAAKECGIKLINCRLPSSIVNNIRAVGNEQIVAFHDRELVLKGVAWLENLLSMYSGVEYCFVKEL